MSLLNRLAEFFTSLVGVIVLVIVAGIGVGLFIFFQSSAEDQKGAMIGQVSSTMKQEFNAFDGKTITGREIIMAAERYQNQPNFTIHVKTGLNATGIYAKNFSAATQQCHPVTAAALAAGTAAPTPGACTATQVATLAEMETVTDTTATSKYINPQGLFRATTHKDASGTVRLLQFVQQN